MRKVFVYGLGRFGFVNDLVLTKSRNDRGDFGA